MQKSLLVILVLISGIAFGQRGANENLKGFDRKPIHFGFYVGSNRLGGKLQLSDALYTTDTIYSVNLKSIPGFSLGVVTDIHLGEYFDFRALFPSLVFGQRDFHYRVRTSDGNIFEDVRQVESTYLAIPMELKYKSMRYGNWRTYLLAGSDFDYDMVSKKNVDANDKSVIRLQKWNYSYSFGFGFEFFFEYFKFAPQFKWNQGINNLLINDGTPFTNVIEGMKSRTFTISLTFEG